MSSGDKVKIKNCVGIKKWPDIADEKTEFCHFGIDTVVGIWHKSFFLTMIDKANKLCCIRRIPNKQVGTVL
ncbi:hypothetical protein [Candidatus Enterovibrio escicola]|uniref:hypothetical protein n=1 Tax=Candidatus Enterovibrio escicola TaxID=1927127 RepID=UPI001CC2B87B|nr:hypothetical protein [Candidatus Enterovibrio escacola]